MSQAKWYVVHTYSGYENKVAENIEKVVENRKLHELIEEVRIPTEMVSELNKDGKTVQAERKLFPSYVLVKMVMTDESWYIVRNPRGVTGLVGPGSKPVPLTEKEVAALGVDRGGKAVEVTFKVGDSVNVIGGSFDGFVGRVTAIDTEAQTAEVVVSMFGRETPVSLPLSQIKAEE